MSATPHPNRTDLLAQPRGSGGLIGRLALRRRSGEHPMAMFAIVTTAAFVSMAFVPAGGPALTALGAPAKLGDDLRTTARVARLPISEREIACRGQAWGEEDESCMRLMAQDSGIDARRKVRRLSAAPQLDGTPNIF